MATPAHFISVYTDGAWALDHPATCHPDQCPYVDSVTDEFIEKKAKVPKPGSVNVYKVTGTDSPSLTKDSDASGDEQRSDGETSTDTDTVYDLIEDREEYDAAVKESTPPEWVDDETKVNPLGLNVQR